MAASINRCTGVYKYMAASICRWYPQPLLAEAMANATNEIRARIGTAFDTAMITNMSRINEHINVISSNTKAYIDQS